MGIKLLTADTTVVNVLNLHVAGLLIIISGAWFVLVTYGGKGSRLMPIILCILAGGVLVFGFILFLTKADVSLGVDSVIPYIYVAGAAIMIGIGVIVLIKIRKLVPILTV